MVVSMTTSRSTFSILYDIYRSKTRFSYNLHGGESDGKNVETHPPGFMVKCLKRKIERSSGRQRKYVVGSIWRTDWSRASSTNSQSIHMDSNFVSHPKSVQRCTLVIDRALLGGSGKTESRHNGQVDDGWMIGPRPETERIR